MRYVITQGYMHHNCLCICLPSKAMEARCGVAEHLRLGTVEKINGVSDIS
jgi:hypothetical protein